MNENNGVSSAEVVDSALLFKLKIAFWNSQGLLY